ncbi:hypothetical protein Pmani_029865 [Petrolisthes manimaculis]|uniref:Uncharacterized protein n=1 Tax=Petrolisthes manimaculis TaxID=1843537 RepID=A0AAE1NYS1_9EUCA|nr:hypothetical protein Pmani_029865 [Petrolisthes manimaculis]
MAVVWKIKDRQWGAEKKHLECKQATSHPLQGVRERVLKHAEPSRDKKTKTAVQSNVVDPLSSVLDGPDPLSDLLGAPDPLSSRMLFAGSQETDKMIEEEVSPTDSRHKTWGQYRQHILSNFTTTGTLTFTSSFLQPSDSGVVKTQTAITERHRAQGMSGSERLRARLEQMDTLDEAGGGGNTVREVGGLTQEEFTHRLVALRKELTQAWHSDQRVKALKIAIQCVKLLSLSAPEHFYPSKFILVMEILDTFAELVHQRLKHKFQIENFEGENADLINLEAQETARNWFYKVASIRELLPRLYLETALLPCYSLFDPEEAETGLGRLSRMIRGLGDPLIAAYARMFLCRMGVSVAPTLNHYIAESLQDFLHALKQGLWPEGEADMNMGEDRDALAARVFGPPLQWMMQCLATRAHHSHLQKVLHQCEEGEGLGQNLLVSAVLATFPHNFVALQSLSITQLIAGCSTPGTSQHDLLCSLGRCVNQAAPPQSQHLTLLNAVWKLVTRIPDTSHYLTTAGVWLEFTAKHFSSLEVNTLLGDVLKHLGGECSPDHLHYPALLALISTALSHSTDPHSLYSMSNFLGILSVFQRDSVGAGAGVTRGVVASLLTHHPGPLTDPTLVQHLLTLSGALHDSINALTTDDERRQISQLIISFIRQVNFGHDFEQQLDFYVNARAAFSNLDSVLVALIQCVCQLGVATWRVMRGQHSGKTAAFVRACAAYCFITVPSLTATTTRLRLYLLSGSVALLNNCLGQGDACMKAAIKEVVEVASCEESEVGGQLTDVLPGLVNNLSSMLVATPDPPDASPPLYLLRGLTNAVRSHPWQKDTDIQCILSISLLHAISAATQDDLPYHIHSVEGNDSLYGGDPQVRQEAESLCSALLEDIVSHMQGLNGVQEKRCGPLALALFWCMVTWCDLSQPPLASLLSRTWTLLSRYLRPNSVKLTKEWVSQRSVQLKDQVLVQLVRECLR